MVREDPVEKQVRELDFCHTCGLSLRDCCCHRLTCIYCGDDDVRDIGDGLLQCVECKEVFSIEEVENGRRSI